MDVLISRSAGRARAMKLLLRISMKVALLVGIKLSREADVRCLRRSFRSNANVEYQRLTICNGSFADIVNGFLLLNFSHCDIFELTREINRPDRDICRHGNSGAFLDDRYIQHRPILATHDAICAGNFRRQVVGRLCAEMHDVITDINIRGYCRLRLGHGRVSPPGVHSRLSRKGLTERPVRL